MNNCVFQLLPCPEIVFVERVSWKGEGTQVVVWMLIVVAVICLCYLTFWWQKHFSFTQLMGKLFSFWLISCLRGRMSHEYWLLLIFSPPCYQNSSSAVLNVIYSFLVCFWSTLGLYLQLSIVLFFPMFELWYFPLSTLCFSLQMGVRIVFLWSINDVQV